jgi:spermidine synthase/MFS family permease
MPAPPPGDEAHDAPVTRRLAPRLAGLLTFLAAGCVLVLEIAAARLLAPYVGVSLTTYTAIIGVILAGIALGAWSGGRAADRFGPEPLIGPTFVLGGLAAMAAVPVVAVAGEQQGGGGAATAVLLAAIGFVGPAAILSAVAPMIVRATIVDLRTSGSLVGRLSAIGTAGAIAGTFLTGFVLLGLFPTRLLVLGTGGFLVVTGLLVAWHLRGDWGRGTDGVPTGSSMLLLAAGGTLLLGSGAAFAPSPCDRESAYYCIAVVPDPARPTGRTLVLDRLRHAYVDLADPAVLEFAYSRWFAAAIDAPLEDRAGELDVLHVGGGGFTFPRYLLDRAPMSRHVVLELDPVVLDVARQELGLEPDPAIDVRVGDARRTIGPLPAGRFHLVIGDAFGGLSVPWHLTTAEFLDEIDRVMHPDGRYVMNLIDGPGLRFVRAETATLRARFAHVAVIATPSSLDGSTSGNVVLVAAHQPLELEQIRQRLEARGDGDAVVVGDDAALDAFTRHAPILTDDHAPVDQLIGR